MKQNLKEVTCLRVYKTTRDKLAEGAKKDQTFDQIINDLIEKSNPGESDGNK